MLTEPTKYHPDHWVDTDAAAEITGLGKRDLEDRRVVRKGKKRRPGPPFSKPSPHTVRYRVRDLHAWMEGRA